MSQQFNPGDFLVFQLESGYGLLRVLDIDHADDESNPTIWHVAAYGDLYPDIEAADTAADSPAKLTTWVEHAALTERAFESTQVSFLKNVTLTANESRALEKWRDNTEREITDRSIRLILGLR